MTRTASQVHSRQPRRNAPTWDVAYLFPNQGDWSEGDYLALDTNHLVELIDGRLEILPMPTVRHQTIVASLWRKLDAHVASRKLGTVLFAALPMRLWEGTFREPDILFMRSQNAHRIKDDYWDGADLVVEVVSKERKGRDRDLRIKRKQYAQAGIAEYWIVDPQEKLVTVLKLGGDRYEVAGQYKPGDRAASHLLAGFAVDVKDILDA